MAHVSSVATPMTAAVPKTHFAGPRTVSADADDGGPDKRHEHPWHDVGEPARLDERRTRVMWAVAATPTATTTMPPMTPMRAARVCR